MILHLRESGRIRLAPRVSQVMVLYKNELTINKTIKSES